VNLTFLPIGWEHYSYWAEHDAKMLARINDLLRDVRRSPFRGIGKPEPLRDSLAGWWSRRIDSEHRLVYRLIGKGDNQMIEIMSCRYHYSR
jgi:toxin YoeB